jgi:hypothetical protein
MFKGTASRDFLLLVFYMNQFPPQPQSTAEIFSKSMCTTGINDTGGKFATSFASVVDTGGKFVNGVNYTSGKFAAGVNNTGGNLPQVPMTPVANNGNNLRQLRP